MRKGKKQMYGPKWYAPINEDFAKRWEQTFGKDSREDKVEEIVYGSDTETGRRTFRFKGVR
jgi:hypothetical protein